MIHNNTARSIIEYNRILNLLFYDIIDHNNTGNVSSVLLTKNQYIILKILKITGPILVSKIAEHMQFSRAAASKNVETLVKLKLISRKIISRDRRMTRISILKNGDKIVEDFEANIDKKQRNALISLSKKEQHKLSELLGKYMNHCLSQKEDIELVCSRCNGKIIDDCALVEHNVKCRFKLHPLIRE